MVFKSSVPTSKKTTRPIGNISWLTPFREIFVVYSEDRMKPINTFCRKNAEAWNVKVSYTEKSFILNSLKRHCYIHIAHFLKVSENTGKQICVS
jgi:hypothetical protein